MVDNVQTILIESARSGDIDSFGRLTTNYYSSMVAIAYSVLADHHLAEDAAQETFAKALLNLKTLKNNEKFAPWLARICRNVAKDMAKARFGEFNTDDLSQLPDNHNEHRDTKLINQAIVRLPRVERELIVLRYYDNLSYLQISDVLGLSKAAINGRLNRAKKKMAKYLKRNGFTEVQL